MEQKGNQIIIQLEKERMHYEQYKYVRKHVKTTKDIYIERNLLKSICFKEKSIDYLVEIITKSIRNNKRFKRYECIKILKRIIKNRKNNTKPLNSNLVNNLFYLYKQYIFNGSEEIQWAVSVFIKDQILDNKQIQWLIDHFEDSEHIANRLLRYPIQNKLISNWAALVYKNGIMNDRISEIVGILIEEDIPGFINVDTNALMWAIYYSRCPVSKKEELILKYLDYNDYSSALSIADRLGISNISKELLNYYRKLYNY